MSYKQMVRPGNRVIAGVCAGIARYFNWEVGLVRIGFVVLTLFTGGFLGVIAYIILWILLPESY